jgi:non-specific serine/threonine protein kinase
VRADFEAAGPQHNGEASEAPLEFGQQVRDALRHVHDRTWLQTHPLARFLATADTRRTDSRGKSLQDSLLAAIEVMRPAADRPADPVQGRAYQLLVRRYVEGEEPTDVQKTLAIGKTEYYAEHQRAIDAVSSWLWERWRPTAPSPSLPATNPVAAAAQSDVKPLVHLLDDPPRHNLPAQLTSFVGRQTETGEVKRLLRGNRLVTLTGTGGCGKTRLALQVGADLLDAFPDGVWLVELAPLSDPALLPSTIARTLDVHEEPARPILTTLIDYLRARRLLLIVDNCEHLIAACAEISQTILQACPDVVILATSRETLGVGGEVAWRVPSLTLPADGALTAGPDWATRAQTSEAVQLFLARARLADPGFDLTSENAPSVVRICTRLDGIPLAIEMAAARLSVLSVDQIAARLDDRFRLLTGGSRAALPRQQTLRAALDWSYNLLSERERRLLRRLSVFASGCSLEAVEAVCSGDGVAEVDVLDLLSRLIARSLVVVDKSGREPRYHLLETIRQYGHDRLVYAEEARATRDAHRDWFLAFAERAEPELIREHQIEWLDRLELEIDNLREALEWSIGREAPDIALRLVGALNWFWFARDYWSEAKAWAERALTGPEAETRTDVRAKALDTLGNNAHFLRLWSTMAEAYEECRSIYQDMGNTNRLAWTLRQLGWPPYARGDLAQAESFFAQSLDLAHENGNVWVIAQAFEGLASVAWERRDYPTAQRLHADSLAHFRLAGDVRAVGWALIFFGEILAERDDLRAAQEALSQGLVLLRKIRSKLRIVWALSDLGIVTWLAGDRARSVELLEESLSLVELTGVRWLTGPVLVARAFVARASGDHPLARQLLVKAVNVQLARDGEQGSSMYGLGMLGVLAIDQGLDQRGICILAAARQRGVSFIGENRLREEALALARSRLDPATAGVAYAEGQAMTPEQAVAYALQTDDG